MFKDVAVIVDGNNGKAGAYASSLAALLGAHLTTIAVNIGSDFEDFAAAEPRYDMIVAERENQEEATNKAVEQIRSEALGEGVDVTSLWLDNVGDGGLVRLDEMTRTFDLVVMDQASPDKPSERTRLIHSIVLKSGRPVLLVPYIQTRRAHFSCVLVAWDGSAPAARALGDAMPLLERAVRHRGQRGQAASQPPRNRRDLPADVQRRRHRSHLIIASCGCQRGSPGHGGLWTHAFAGGFIRRHDADRP